MKGDFTRFTFDAEKHYRNVLTQQGRVTVDADPNEQQFITSFRIETEAADLIGGCGAPLHNAGFKLNPAGASLTIGDGRFYVDGILCENGKPNLSIDAQPDLPANGVLAQPDGTALPIGNATPGIYFAYLDVWLRHVTALEDDSIREKALGGPDTATRVKPAWQVRLFRLGDPGTPFNCLSQSAAFDALKQGTTGKLRARAEVGAADDKPCVVPPGAGFRRLENQLYRVEVHNGGALGTATFKWSRDNGSVVTNWKSAAPNPANPASHLDLTVGSIGRDKVLRFAGGQWVELTDDTREETARPGTFVQVVKAEGEIVTVDATTAFPAGALNIANFPKNAKVRRWDFRDKPQDIKIVQPASPNDWLKLEDGLEVKFEAGNYRTGDYWLIPARTVEPFIEWPKETGVNPPPAALSPHGVEHRYCRLALVSRIGNGPWNVVSDCRKLFPPVTELTSLFYVSGDGQEVMPNLTQPATTFFPLPKQLKVGVANGQWPVQGARVRFELLTPNSGQLNGLLNQAEVVTGADGIAACNWDLRWAVPPPPSPPVLLLSQQVKATLLKADGNPSVHLPVIFTANLSIADQVAYDPSKCPDLAGITTVQDAIDKLCERKPGGGCSVSVGKDGQFQTLNEAVKTLLAEGRRELCLCLLPGEHGLTDHLVVEGDPNIVIKNLTIKIEGCGRGSRLNSPRFQMRFNNLAGVTLEGIDASMREQDSPLVIANCGQVTISDCDLLGSSASPSKGGLLLLAGNGRTWVENSVLASYDTNRFDLHRNILKPSSFAGLFNAFNQRAIAQFIPAVAQAIVTTPARERQQMASGIRGNVGAATLDNEEVVAYNNLLELLPGNMSVTQLAGKLTLLRKVVVSKSIARAMVIINPLDAVTLEDDTLIGLLSLYGPGGSVQLSDEMLRARSPQFKASARLNPSNAALFLRNNDLTRIVLGDELLKTILDKLIPGNNQPVEIDNVFSWLSLTDNNFDAGNNQFLGSHCSLSTNRFPVTVGTTPTALMHGAVLAETGSYVANSCFNKGGFLDVLQKQLPSEKAANVNVAVTDL